MSGAFLRAVTALPAMFTSFRIFNALEMAETTRKL
jgi:hypothetical protein